MATLWIHLLGVSFGAKKWNGPWNTLDRVTLDVDFLELIGAICKRKGFGGIKRLGRGL